MVKNVCQMTYRHTHSKYLIVTASYSINSFWSREMFYCNTHKKWETARLICHSDLFSPEKFMSQWTFFFCFSSASDTSQECLCKFYCCRRYKFVIKTLLCNTCCFCIVNSDMQFNNTHRMLCCVSTTTMVTRTRHNATLYGHYLFCYKLTWLVNSPAPVMKPESYFLCSW
jgi:hypothetical protein